jgi:predicted metal-dependent peptidase
MTETRVKKYNLNKDIYHLLKDEPYFALLSRQLDKRPTTSIPTAGIKYDKDRVQYEIVYNPEFFAGLSSEHKKWVLMHELYHASLGHTEYRQLEFVPKKLANAAMDLAINSLPNMVHSAPDFVLMPGRAPFEFCDLPEQSANWYAHKIKKDADENPDKYSSDIEGQFDDHAEPGDGSPDSDGVAIAQKKLQDAIAKAAKECDVGDGRGGTPKGWGSMSRKTKKLIKDYAKSSFSLSPKQVLASFIKASIAADTKTSVTKRNRRLPGLKFGKKHNYRAKIAVSIDQSGSVSDKLLAEVFGWLSEFAKFASFTVIPFDHEVAEEKIYVWKKGETRKRERVLYGGTDFNAPTKWVNSKNFDGHIVITDMQAPQPVHSKCQRIWLTDAYGARSNYFSPKGEKVLILG